MNKLSRWVRVGVLALLAVSASGCCVLRPFGEGHGHGRGYDSSAEHRSHDGDRGGQRSGSRRD